MAASLEDVSMRLEATIREEGDSTRQEHSVANSPHSNGHRKEYGLAYVRFAFVILQATRPARMASISGLVRQKLRWPIVSNLALLGVLFAAGCVVSRLFLDESMKRLESRADEMLSKLGRMDRMLDHVVEGSADCPRLFVLTPVTDVQAVGFSSGFLYSFFF